MMWLIFQANTTDGGVYTITFSQDIQTMYLTFSPHDPTQPIYIESVLPTKADFPHTILVDKENLKDMSNPQELFQVHENTFTVTLSSTMGTQDLIGNLVGKFENVDNITVRAKPTGEVIKVSLFTSIS